MLAIALAGFSLGLALTAATRWLGRRHGLVAVPNARSSHRAPLVAIGGLGFVAPLAAWLCWHLAEQGGAFAVALAAGAIGLALIGLLDDLFELSPPLRLGLHLLAAGAVVAALGEASVLAWAALTLGLAWFVNLYNFMDGIDGIAASQAIIFALGGLWLGDAGAMGPGLWLLAAACAGFLCLNWPPAKIIMGDVGSCCLGFFIGAVALRLWQAEALPLWASAILLAAFWVDATYTLIVRLATGQRMTAAHRSHAYQKLARRFGHARVSGGLWLCALVWLAPLAAVSVRLEEFGPLWMTLAAAPFLALCVAFRAGVPED